MIPPNRVRERILLIGTWGTGKSEAWYKIAEWYRKTGSSARFFIGDSDYGSADRILADLEMEEVKLDGLTFRKYGGNCYVYDLDEWDTFMAFAKFTSKNSLPDDWTIVDMIPAAWQRVQDAYTEMVYGKDIADFYVEKKRASVAAGKSGHAMADAYGSNWQVINKMYGGFTQLLLRNRGHILACAPAEKVDRENDDSDTVREYGKFGYKPTGQKHTGHLFHTVLLLQQTPKGWSYSTLRDRKREGKTNQALTDFVLGYLVGVAGWKLKEEG